MNHEEALNLVPAYSDNELSVAEAAGFERHLNGCDECQQEYAEQVRMSALVKHNAVYFEASPQLAKRLVAALPKAQSSKKTNSIWDWNWIIAWGGKGAVMASLVAIVWSTSLFLATPSFQEKLTGELIASHIRSLQVDHLSDVISTDQHTVKPWFKGMLDFSPPVIDFSSSGFPLEGGRLDYINGRTVAVIIYHHNKHPINLYVWPDSSKDSGLQNTNRNGYNLVHWAVNGMDYWVVSDLEARKLTSFAESLHNQLGKPMKARGQE
ncbi:MAG: anti-sigma factor [Methylobacter sp.]|nr:anti-sigma factor [Methylobacter sp.]